MKRSLWIWAAFGSGFLLPSLPAQAVDSTSPPLGRLFMTPERRQALERQREINLKQASRIEEGSLRLDGIVVRSSGKSTVWINSRPQPEDARDTGISATVTPRRPTRASVAAGVDVPVDLQVGATLDRSSRAVSGGLTEGEISVRRPAAQK